MCDRRIAVPLVFQVALVTAVIFMGTAVAVVAEGSCLEWKDAEESRRKAEHDLEDTWRELKSTRHAAIPVPATAGGVGGVWPDA
jgi:hypothetical protein